MELINYIEQFENIVLDGFIESKCNQITFINTGATNVSVNNLTLLPGQQYVSTGNIRELNCTRYNVVLNGGSVIVVRKVYQ